MVPIGITGQISVHACWVQGRDAYLAHRNEKEKEPLTWEQFREQVLEAGEQYWVDVLGHPAMQRRGRGRFSDLRHRCWNRIHGALLHYHREGRLEMAEDGLPLVDGKKVTQGQLVRWIKYGHPPTKQALVKDTIATRYARWWRVGRMGAKLANMSEADLKFYERVDPYWGAIHCAMYRGIATMKADDLDRAIEILKKDLDVHEPRSQAHRDLCILDSMMERNNSDLEIPEESAESDTVLLNKMRMVPCLSRT